MTGGNMLHEVFYWVLNMSIIASFFGVLLYCLRFIKGFPKLASYMLWAVVLLRLLCPFGISSEYSLLNIIVTITQKTYVKTVPLGDTKGSMEFLPKLSTSNTIQGAATYQPFSYKTSTLENFFEIASVIWLIVAIAAIIAVVVLYLLTKSELKKAEFIRDNIYEGTMINTPTVYGIIKPKIVLPIGIEKKHLEYILAHERIHIRRLDNIWRMVAIVTVCIHWFNPLSWLFLKCFLEDCELSCDAAAVKGRKAEDRNYYAQVLLLYATMENTVFSSAFGSSKVKIRIKNVLSYRKLTVYSTIYFIGMVLAILYLLLTNAVG
jgi:beta-lactamase regulating signal transducer with metallopeptidase domain